MSLFLEYRDAETRKAMIDYVVRSRIVDAVTAERELQALNAVGLAYVYRDMIAEEAKSTASVVDYDPIYGAGA